jgi:hypothetical protein
MSDYEQVANDVQRMFSTSDVQESQQLQEKLAKLEMEPSKHIPQLLQIINYTDAQFPQKGKQEIVNLKMSLAVYVK